MKGKGCDLKCVWLFWEVLHVKICVGRIEEKCLVCRRKQKNAGFYSSFNSQSKKWEKDDKGGEVAGVWHMVREWSMLVVWIEEETGDGKNRFLRKRKPSPFYIFVILIRKMRDTEDECKCCWLRVNFFQCKATFNLYINKFGFFYFQINYEVTLRPKLW